jgi:hypothetical protein
MKQLGITAGDTSASRPMGMSYDAHPVNEVHKSNMTLYALII